RKAGDLFSLMARWKEYTTSSALSALPLANLPPDLSLKVTSQLAPLSLMSQLCARLGLMVERSAPSNFTRVSYTLWARRTPLNSYATAGSSEIRSLTSAYQTSVLAAPPAEADGVAVALAPPGDVAGAHAAATSIAATNDRPILFREGRFFLLHAPSGIIAAYRKCTHLGCAVPWNDAEDRFHCPCHGSLYDKRTAVVLRTPAPKPLQLFHIAENAE